MECGKPSPLRRFDGLKSLILSGELRETTIGIVDHIVNLHQKVRNIIDHAQDEISVESFSTKIVKT